MTHATPASDTLQRAAEAQGGRAGKGTAGASVLNRDAGVLSSGYPHTE